ncbi:type II 3-dehydroquinate dehydratase [Paratractidigestivibacter sp.]|uniref:type II 3-dehydroquinate dehydratase n=1 Tax=Paratractidigestivibacter sp. TaxID=2847316 RepID=UPI002ABE8E4E|nr:type II 3-dehydroquinate dehydratase [Paratractidigestivibacter sp.]
MSKALQIAQEVLAAVGGKKNVTGNELCMTRLRIRTEDASLIDSEQIASMRGVLGIVEHGNQGIEVVFGPGRAEEVHEAIANLTGVEDIDEYTDARATSPMNVIVSGERDESAQAEVPSARAYAQNPEGAAADEKDDLAQVKDLIWLLNEKSGAVEADARAARPKKATESVDDEQTCPRAKLLVINGPNINMLGIREPGIYGTENFQALLKLCRDTADELGFDDCQCFQSNHEGDLVDAIQGAYGKYDGIVINPGAYTHTSIAILDAAKAVNIPMVEVHISKVEEREEFRQVSYIRSACFETITGMGIQGYRRAIIDLADKLGL